MSDEDETELNGQSDEENAENTTTPTAPESQESRIAELVVRKVGTVLNDKIGLGEKRARTIDENGFLKLLIAFNEEGVHFA